MARTRERERRAHRPLNSAGLKKREDQQGGMFDSLCKEDFKTFRPKAGQNNVRFLEGTWPDAEHWAHDTWIHNQIGPDNGRYFCLQKMLNQPCPLCDERRNLMAAGETEAAKEISARKGACAWVINRDDEDAGPLLWFYGRTVDEEFAGRCRNRKTGEPIDIIHPDEGNDVFFKMTKKGKAASNVEYGSYEIDLDPTPVSDNQKEQDRWLDFVEENPVPDCFNYYDAEYLKNLITGSQMAKAAADDDDDEEDERPRGRRRSIDDDEDEPPKRRARASRDEDEDDDPPPRRRVVKDEDEDDDEPVSKRRRQRDDSDDDAEPPPRRRRVVDDDDDDDPPPRRARRSTVDDDEDEPPPRSRSKRRAAEEDADEEEEAPPPRRTRTRLNEDEDEPPKRRARSRDDDDDGEDVVRQAKRSLSRLKDEEADEDEPPRKRRRL